MSCPCPSFVCCPLARSEVGMNVYCVVTAGRVLGESIGGSRSVFVRLGAGLQSTGGGPIEMKLGRFQG